MTLAFWAMGRFEGRRVLPYVGAQLAGAALGSGLVKLRVTSGSKQMGMLAGLAISATVALEALVAGPLTGASMNPARPLAPALLSGN